MKQQNLSRIFMGLIFLIISAAALWAGGGQSGSSAKPESPKLRVGMLLPGPINDGGWNASAYEGLQDIKLKYPDADVSYQESVPPSNFEEIFRSYASQGYNLVIGHGFQFGDAAIKVSKEFPNVKFCVTSTSSHFSPPNVCCVLNDTGEMGYLLGVLAACMTKTKIVGVIGGVDIPPIADPVLAFELAVKSVDPGIRVLSTLTGSSEDVPKAKEVALNMIEQGADIVFADANQSSLGVFDACQEKKIWALAPISDQHAYAPGTILTSGICAVPKAISAVADLVVAGTLEPKFYKMGAAQDAVWLAPFYELDSQVPQQAKDAVAKALADLKSGAIDVDAILSTYRAK
jgi:basic membrane protein A